MALALFDRVQETTTTTGTGAVTLAGAVSGFQSFAVVGNGNTCYYTILDGTAWEVGIGTYSSVGPSLARTTVLSNSSGTTSPLTLASGTKTVFLTYPAEKSVNLDASGNVSPLGTVSSGVWQGTTVGVAYGGTGVTASSGANSVMLRDANQNVSINRLNQSSTTVTAAAGTTTLTAASTFSQILTGTGGQTFKLPDATTLTNTTTFEFNNNATGTLTITDNASAVVGTISSGGAAAIALLANGTVGGTWDVHAYIPENVTWGTNSLALGSTVITGGTWNGGVISTAYGGTGLSGATPFSSGGALYATTTSALTSGTLPASAGGTGVNNGSSTITLAGSVTHAGAFARTFTATGATIVTLPTSGYLLSSVTQLGANPVTGTPTSSNYLRGDGTWAAVPSSMVYPGAGIPNSTSTAWGTSYGVSGTGTTVALTAGPTFTGTLNAAAISATTNIYSGTGTAIDPAGVSGAAIGQITATTGWSVPGIAFGVGAGSHAAIGYGGGTMYFGTETGTTNTMNTRATLTSGGNFTATGTLAGTNIGVNSTTTYGYAATPTIRNSYYGLLLGTTTSHINVMADGSGNGGFYREASSNWGIYWNISDGCVGINTSTTSPAYGAYVNKGIYSNAAIVANSSVVANGITLNQERSTNARLYGATTGSFGLLGVDSAGTFKWQIYGSTGDYGFLNSTWGDWDLHKVVNGQLYVRVSGAEQLVFNASQTSITTAGNPTWGGRVQLGGNGGGSGSATIATMQATNGNLHLDAGSGNQIYLGYYQGTQVNFGNGAGTAANASITAGGAISTNSTITANGTGTINGYFYSNSRHYAPGGIQLAGEFLLQNSGATYDNSTGARMSESYGPIWNLSNSSTWHFQVINGSILSGISASGNNYGGGNVYASGKVVIGATGGPSTGTAITYTQGTMPGYVVRSFCNFTTGGSVCTVRSSGNVSSVSYLAAGQYQVNFSTSFPNNLFVPFAEASNAGYIAGTVSQTTTSYNIWIVDATSGFPYVNPSIVKTLVMQ